MAILRIIGLANGQPSPFDGQYICSYDPTRHRPDGSYDGGDLIVTHDPERALDLPVAKLWAVWRKPAGCECHGVRWDGELNRPLTAWTVEIIGTQRSPIDGKRYFVPNPSDKKYFVPNPPVKIRNQ